MIRNLRTFKPLLHSERRITLIVYVSVFVICFSVAVPAIAFENSCWGQATAVFAQMGEMGEHASQQPNPRAGLRNLARSLAADGTIPDDSMQALGAFVSNALGLSIDACMEADRKTVANIDYLGMVIFETGFMFEATELGGLSGITYDSQRGVYYALSDDRNQFNPARYYTLSIDLSDGALDDGDVSFQKVTTLLDDSGSPFAENSIDPEGIVLASPGFLYISSEGDVNATQPIPPFVNRFNLPGRQTQSLPVPEKFLPNAGGTSGVRDSLAFESLTVTPTRRFLYTATENALAQDGPVAGLAQGSLSRMLEYDVKLKRPGLEFVYVVDPVAEVPIPPEAFRNNGLVELQALDNTGTFLAMERSFSVGVGFTIKLYEVLTQEATDVSGVDDLFDENTGTPGDFVPVQKRLLLNFAELGAELGSEFDNLEGMTIGSMLSDGRLQLIVVSDNNFNPVQQTQFIALALELETVSDD